MRRGCVVPVWKAFPYLLCGDSAWEINRESADAGEVVYQCPDDNGGSVRCAMLQAAAISKYGRGGGSGWAVVDQNEGKVGGCTVNIIDIPASQA